MDYRKLLRIADGSDGYLSNVYLSDKFLRWFKGSKIVEEDGTPKLLGHATRNFGFNKFDTPFIHLSSINGASYFSGGHKRMFKLEETIAKLSDDEVVDMYNKYFAYKDSRFVRMTPEVWDSILKQYEVRFEQAEKRAKIWGMSVDEVKELLSACKSALDVKYNTDKGDLYYKEFNGSVYLVPAGYSRRMSVEEKVETWLKEYFPNVDAIRSCLASEMFHREDKYAGTGGTYALCARVLNPLEVECNWRPWDSIYISPQSCADYDKMWDACEELFPEVLKRVRNKGSWFSLDNESIAMLAQKIGHDGVIFHHIKEGDVDYDAVRLDETYIVFSTKQLKSPFENSGEFADVEDIFG